MDMVLCLIRPFLCFVPHRVWAYFYGLITPIYVDSLTYNRKLSDYLIKWYQCPICEIDLSLTLCSISKLIQALQIKKILT